MKTAILTLLLGCASIGQSAIFYGPYGCGCYPRGRVAVAYAPGWRAGWYPVYRPRVVYYAAPAHAPAYYVNPAPPPPPPVAYRAPAPAPVPVCPAPPPPPQCAKPAPAAVHKTYAKRHTKPVVHAKKTATRPCTAPAA